MLIIKFILGVIGAVFGVIIAECGFQFNYAFRFERNFSFTIISLLLIFIGTSIAVCAIYFNFIEPLLTMGG